ncbi:HNH endonuclease [Sulfitobacter pseudonitzschiae]|nr:HNH endonuclease [Pseudosulfitobacter pseudonitzschiae]MBM1834204.1 HNH endonuclease [Pseudosulfitobacter pseudonitzschiae]MBM1839069.1 HNH endonuclease [Pseudosulfitobacter pseudonitzschiae]MBM1843917.1 HNH endonuclease [Pseudosulfitobacter pseudonitzschiae]MBM1848754.1 HNH endonuclease [Pseudosulfitobacter pseudonitzschiae]
MMGVVIPFSGDICLEWEFGNNGRGYGVFHEDGKAVAAHVYACRAVHGERPSVDHEVAHSCGRGHLLCVNPRHLRWSTRSENFQDMKDHGTVQYGSKNPANKLREEQVLEIRKMIGTLPQHEIARRFGISQMTISNISTGKTWGWLRA